MGEDSRVKVGDFGCSIILEDGNDEIDLPRECLFNRKIAPPELMDEGKIGFYTDAW